jgi:hypothetical protein
MRGSEGGKNRDKKRVMVKLIIEKKNTRFRSNKKLSFSKSSVVIPWASNSG